MVAQTSQPQLARRAVAWDNGLLQMAYVLIAARALGLDAGPMAGFNRDLLDAEFFPDGQFVAQYLVNFGYSDDTKTWHRRAGASAVTTCPCRPDPRHPAAEPR